MWYFVAGGVAVLFLLWWKRRNDAPDLGSVSRQWMVDHNVATGHEHDWLAKRDR